MITGVANDEQTSVGCSRARERQREEERPFRAIEESTVLLFTMTLLVQEFRQSLHKKKSPLNPKRTLSTSGISAATSRNEGKSQQRSQNLTSSC